MSQDLRGNRRSFTGDYTGGSGRGGGNGKLNELAGPEKMRRGDAGPGGADIQRFGQFDELRSGYIHSPQEDRYLETNAG